MPGSLKSRAEPTFVTPMAAAAVTELPQGDEWLYELKLDGYRALVLRVGGRVQIRSRNDKDLTRMYPTVASAALRLKADRVMLDGEIVALGPDGRPAFQALQHRGSNQTHQIVFYAFDVLHLNGNDLTSDPLIKRRARLSKVIGHQDPVLRLSQDLPGSATKVVEAVRAAGLEGVIAKRKNSLYRAGERSSDWVKLKLERQQEFVVGGYRPDGAGAVDALLVGYYDEGRSLRFAGKVRAGMVPHIRRDLLRKLKPLEVTGCPFINLPDARASRWGGGVTIEQMDTMRWVKQDLVVQIRFVEWTAEGRLRHAKFLGLRQDKPAKEIVRE
jgi:DNA ligase D-like protein (predicted ligase)